MKTKGILDVLKCQAAALVKKLAGFRLMPHGKGKMHEKSEDHRHEKGELSGFDRKI